MILWVRDLGLAWFTRVSDLGVACPGAVRWLQLDSWLVPASLPVILQQAGSGLFTVGPEHRAPREQAEAARPSSPLPCCDLLCILWVRASRGAGPDSPHGAVTKWHFWGHRCREDSDFCNLPHLNILFFQYFTHRKSKFYLLLENLNAYSVFYRYYRYYQ